MPPKSPAVAFEVTDAVIPSRHNNFAEIPGHEDLLLRWYPRDHVFSSDLFESSESAERAAQRLTKHLGALSTTGLYIPANHSFVAKTEVQMRPSGILPVISIQTVVEKVAILQRIESDEEHLHIVESLRNYYQWVIDNEETHYLDDLFDFDQYCVTEQGVTLLDIEPMFSPAILADKNSKIMGWGLRRDMQLASIWLDN